MNKHKTKNSVGRAAVPANSCATVLGRAYQFKGKRGKNRATVGGHGGPPY